MTSGTCSGGRSLVPFNVFIALGIGAIAVVVTSVAASMTLLPAILSLLGDKLERLSVPIIGARTGGV